PEEAAAHPDASVLTRAIGQSREVRLDIAELSLKAQDSLLLCSDGLWAYTTPEDIRAVVTSPNLSPSGVAEALLRLALEGGGGDNISIQFLHFSASPPTPEPAHSGSARKMPLVVVGVVVLTCALAGLFTWNYYHQPSQTASTVPVTRNPPQGTSRD